MPGFAPNAGVWMFVLLSNERRRFDSGGRVLPVVGDKIAVVISPAGNDDWEVSIIIIISVNKVSSTENRGVIE